MIMALGTGAMWLSLALSLAAFASFAWALRGHFESDGRIPDGMRLLSFGSLISYGSFIVLLLWRGCQPAIWTDLGLVGFVASILLFWWTVMTTRWHPPHMAFTNADPDVIYTGGPYAHVRHPFYLSYIIFWIATALFAGLLQWVPALILSLCYIRIAQIEERRFGSSLLSTGYKIYRGHTGMLVPGLGLSRR
jgi:protein-S-isoprenylcysteine O-methyltransferase Ste14